MRNTVRQVVSLTLILVGLYVAFLLQWPQLLYHSAWVIVVFYVVLFAGLQLASVWVLRHSGTKSTQLLLQLRLIHLFASLIFAVIFLVTDREHAALFVGNFFVAYLITVTFEIRALMANLRTHLQSHKPHAADKTS